MDERGNISAVVQCGSILVVDDEVGIRRLVASTLERKGYAVAEATSGDLALQCLQQSPFDLVITDLKMPKMDGLTLFGRCRTLYPETEVIIMTGHGTIESAVEAMKRGIYDYVIKPFEVEELVQKADNCLEQRRARAEARAESPIEPLIELGRVLSETASLSETMNSIVELLQRTFEASSIEMVLFGDTPQGDVILVQEGEPPKKLGYPPLEHQDIQQLSRKRQPWLLRNKEPITSSDARTPTGFGITVPLLTGGQLVGQVTIVRNDREPPYAETDAQLLQVFCFQIGISILQAQTHQRLVDAFRDLRRATLSTVESLFAALETCDPETHGHSQRVATYASWLGQRIGLDDDSLETLHIASLLHDVGKLGIGEGTLRKNGSLTPAERERIKMHPVMGARILGGIEALSQVTPLVLHHHERYDGTGYPAQLSGEDIPLGARIIAVVDTYDSMTSNRPYRFRFSVQEALSCLREIAGSQLDPSLVEEWCAIVLEQEMVGFAP